MKSVDQDGWLEVVVGAILAFLGPVAVVVVTYLTGRSRLDHLQNTATAILTLQRDLKDTRYRQKALDETLDKILTRIRVSIEASPVPRSLRWTGVAVMLVGYCGLPLSPYLDSRASTYQSSAYDASRLLRTANPTEQERIQRRMTTLQEAAEHYQSWGRYVLYAALVAIVLGAVAAVTGLIWGYVHEKKLLVAPKTRQSAALGAA